MDTSQFDVFISYARRDGSQLAGKLSESLREAGMKVFWDHDSIPGGVNWEDAIDNALELATHIVVILTPFSVKSEEVTAEWRPMLNKGKNVLPLLYLPCEIPRRLTMKQYIDCQNEDDYLVALSELIQAINTFKGSNLAHLELSGQELLKRGLSYFESGQLEASANDYLLALQDTDKIVRKRAAILVGKAKVLNQLPLIIQHANQETDQEIKIELLDSMRKIVETTEWRAEIPDLHEELRQFVESEIVEVRCQAMRIMAYGGVLDAVPMLINALFSDPDKRGRHQAALALARLITNKSTNALVTALTDTDSGVRRVAARALGMHGNLDTIVPLKIIAKADKNLEVRAAANEAIERIRALHTSRS